MSIIKRLQLQGFKSFANPTILNFEDGFNTIVGGNGSGKSNVFDALCFVLGRMSSKGLRADKLGNLVFNGGKNSKPAKEAQVSIFLSNDNGELLKSDLNEVKISRVVSRDGQSRYLLNNQRVTRTEIVEILKRAQIDPDGYNIILQGDIMRIVNMTPIERRELIEEISNISGYEEKRQKALKKLDDIELNLKEADLLMDEKTKYLKELKHEKEQAEKFHKTKDDLRFNSLLLLKGKLIRNEKLKEKKVEELNKNEESLLEYKDKLAEFDQKTAEINKEISSLEKTIEVKSHQDFISITNNITKLEEQLKSLYEKKAEYNKQREEIKQRITGLKENISQNKDKLKLITSELKSFTDEKVSLEKDLAKVEKELNESKLAMSGTNFSQIDLIDEKIDSLQEKKVSKISIRQDNAIQIEKLNTKLENLEHQQSKIEGFAKENKSQAESLDKYRKELKKIILEISTTANKNSEYSSNFAKVNQEYNSYLEKHQKMRFKAESSKDLMASNRAVEFVLKYKKQDSSILGSVSELASVPQKYSLALETIAGKNLFNIVVNNDETAVRYINLLREQKIGNATFLPLNKVNKKAILDNKVLNKAGVIDYALNLINFDKKYEGIFNLVFGDFLVIDSIENAKKIGIGEYKMVSLEGDVVTKTGAMSGGFRRKSSGVGAFKDEDAQEQLIILEEKLNSLRNSLDHLKDQKDQTETNLYELKKEKSELESEILKLEKILSIEGTDLNVIKKDMENLMGDKAVIEGSLKKIDREISQIDQEIADLNLEKNKLKQKSGGNNVFEEISKIESKRDKLKEKSLELISEISSREIQIKNVLEPELSNLNKIIENSTLSLTKIENQISENKEQIKILEEDLNKFKKQEKELSKDYKQFIEKRDLLKEQRKKLEEKFEKEFSKFDKIKEVNAQLRYQISEFDTLKNTYNEELDFMYEEIKTELVIYDSQSNSVDETRVEELINQVEEKLKNTIVDVKELQTKVNNLKSKLTSFGSINMKAVEIYDKLDEEFNLLIEKREALNLDKKEILDFVLEMDDKKKERFMETFEKLREHFVSIFSQLSTKGDAELNLEDQNNLFNTGVEIKVRLSRNNYLDIKSLSGGEKTITAVAFIFAVQEFNPASFYIFDEVDAALDIMNCEKLGKLIAQNASKAQYIVVSHSEYLIQSSNYIYGVTMDKNKVSGVVSLDLSQTGNFVDSAPEVK